MYYVEWQDEDCSDTCFPYSSKGFFTLGSARDWRDFINPFGLVTRIIYHDATTNDWEIVEMD